jgi:hypothetical protein
MINAIEKETILARALRSTRLPGTQKVNLPTVAHALSACGYITAITNKGGFDFSFLQEYANKYKFPMLVLLSMTYATGHIRQHLIDIVPLTVDKEIHMHIVEGCNPPKKMIPVNETNLNWCSGECESCIVKQFVVFLPEKKAVKKLLDDDKFDGVYLKRAVSKKTLSESISSMSCQYTG